MVMRIFSTKWTLLAVCLVLLISGCKKEQQNGPNSKLAEIAGIYEATCRMKVKSFKVSDPKYNYLQSYINNNSLFDVDKIELIIDPKDPNALVLNEQDMKIRFIESTPTSYGVLFNIDDFQFNDSDEINGVYTKISFSPGTKQYILRDKNGNETDLYQALYDGRDKTFAFSLRMDATLYFERQGEYGYTNAISCYYRLDVEIIGEKQLRNK